MRNRAVYRLFSSFDDPAISPEAWNRLLDGGPSDVVFLTWQYQKAWWEALGSGELLLVTAEVKGKLALIAPLFAVSGMVYFVGSGGSDYLDFIGSTEDEDMVDGLMAFAAQQVKGFLGFQLFHMPEGSRSENSIKIAANRQGWELIEESSWACPKLEMREYPDKASEAVRKKSLRRHEAYFERTGDLKIEHLTTGEQILLHLDEFFDQHIERWRQSRNPSLFTQPSNRLFYRRLTEVASETDWLRFTRVVWNGRPIAFHFGFNYKSSFLWYKPCFDVSLASHSPGEVLLRQLLLSAQAENAHTFDFGMGDEKFKSRFATSTKFVRVWGIYSHEAKNVLVLSPHPDDESIGCGGTLRKHCLNGDNVEVVFLTSGEHGGHGRSPEETIKIREQEAQAAATILGISKIDFWREPDGTLELSERILMRLIGKLKDFQPDILYVPHENEHHVDHRVAAELVRRAVDSLPESVRKPTVKMFEVWTPLQGVDHIIDISAHVDIKRQAILAYKSQCDEVKFDEAILGLNRYRGELYSWPGGDYAEVFKEMT